MSIYRLNILIYRLIITNIRNSKQFNLYFADLLYQYILTIISIYIDLYLYMSTYYLDLSTYYLDILTYYKSRLLGTNNFFFKSLCRLIISICRLIISMVLLIKSISIYCLGLLAYVFGYHFLNCRDNNNQLLHCIGFYSCFVFIFTRR